MKRHKTQSPKGDRIDDQKRILREMDRVTTHSGKAGTRSTVSLHSHMLSRRLSLRPSLFTPAGRDSATEIHRARKPKPRFEWESQFSSMEPGGQLPQRVAKLTNGAPFEKTFSKLKHGDLQV